MYVCLHMYCVVSVCVKPMTVLWAHDNWDRSQGPSLSPSPETAPLRACFQGVLPALFALLLLSVRFVYLFTSCFCRRQRKQRGCS